MAVLLPVKQTGLWTGAKVSRHNATIFFAKQDLPYAETLDEVTMLASATEPAYALGVFGDKSIFTFAPQPADKTHLLGVWRLESPSYGYKSRRGCMYLHRGVRALWNCEIHVTIVHTVGVGTEVGAHARTILCGAGSSHMTAPVASFS